MKVYFYTRYFSDDLRYILSEGTRKAIHGLVSGMVNCGVEVTILCEGKEDAVYEMDSGYQIRQFCNASRFKNFNVPKSLKSFIAKNLDRNTLIVLNGIFQPKISSLSYFLKRFEIPYIYAPHDPYHPSIFNSRSYLKWPYWYLFECKLLQGAKAIQVLDIRHADYLRHLKVSTPVIPAPNGFSNRDLHAEETLTWDLERSPELFFLGRMDTHNKGLDLLLDAFSETVNTVASRLTLQGKDKGDRPALEARANALGLSNQISFLEPDYDQSSSRLIQKYDIFCLPSRFEGFGLSALEAMLAGRVLLVSNVAGIAPHVRASGCGIVVEPRVDDIKKGLLELLSQRAKWKEMGLNGRRHALENLQWDKIAANVLDDYQKVLLQ